MPWFHQALNAALLYAVNIDHKSKIVERRSVVTVSKEKVGQAFSACINHTTHIDMLQKE